MLYIIFVVGWFKILSNNNLLYIGVVEMRHVENMVVDDPHDQDEGT